MAKRVDIPLSFRHLNDTILQRYSLQGNILEIIVNNGDSIPLPVRNNSHTCTESTQTNWNGIIGKMELIARDPLHIVSAIPFPQADAGNQRVDITLSQPAPKGFVLHVEEKIARYRKKLIPNQLISPFGFRQTI